MDVFQSQHKAHHLAPLCLLRSTEQTHSHQPPAPGPGAISRLPASPVFSLGRGAFCPGHPQVTGTPQQRPLGVFLEPFSSRFSGRPAPREAALAAGKLWENPLSPSLCLVICTSTLTPSLRVTVFVTEATETDGRWPN